MFMLGDSIKMDLRETGYGESDWIKSRAEKLTRMNKVMNHRVP
jgi:hypothetical protein